MAYVSGDSDTLKAKTDNHGTRKYSKTTHRYLIELGELKEDEQVVISNSNQEEIAFHVYRVNKEQMETCYGMPGWGEFKSNFTLFLDCIISEDQIVLPPVSIPQWRIGTSSYPTPLAYTYFTDYRKPYVFLGDIPSNGQFFVRGICARPIIPDFLSDGTFNPASKKGAIYWMDVENGGSKGEFFVNLCLCNLLDYIRQLKASVTLPNMSVDILGNVDSAYQELRQKCDVYALQSGWYGDLLL